MADYKRVVLYMYEYDQDIKKGSLGFSRVESNDDQCKVVVHISKPNWSNRSFRVYMYKRDPSSYKYVNLGELYMSGGIGDLKVKTNKYSIQNSGIALDHMNGIVITDGTNSYIAGDWDNKGIAYRNVKQIEEHLTQPEEELEPSSEKDQIEIEKLSNKQESIQEPSKEMVTMFVPSEEIKKAPRNISKNEQTQTQEEVVKSEKKEESVKLEQKEESVSSESDDMKGSSLGAVVQNDEWVVQLAKNLQTIFTATQEMNYNEAKSEAEPAASMNQETTEQGASEFMFGKMSQDDPSVYDLHPCANNILMKFPRIYPFEDNEIYECVRIEPQDIGLLPIEAWVLGNNSFLLHGYYSYHHLVFGKMQHGDGYVYILGVPGIYQNRERFMARMFGFNDFKCAKAKEQMNGEFGYWYLPIMIA